MSHPLKNAKWITCGMDVSSPVITRRFFAENIKKATLFVTGIGYFEARVNGELLHEEKFLPVVSDYEPRDLSKFYYPLHDVVTNRVYFYEFDVTDKIKDRENGLIVGMTPEAIAEGIIRMVREEELSQKCIRALQDEKLGNPGEINKLYTFLKA